MKSGIILGIDESGRGPLAGPVVVVGCILNSFKLLDKLNDSKKLTIKAREYLYPILIKETINQIEMVDSKEIDRIGISAAIKSCIEKIYEDLHNKASQTIFDGNWDPIHQSDFKVIVKADSLIKEVSAASIIAKVYRDHLMIEYAKKYPEYGFEWHKGYGTSKHIKAIRKYGYCPIHRQSFHIKGKNYLENEGNEV